MELDSLKRTWEEYEKKLDASLRLNTRLLRDSVLGKVKTAMTRLSLLLSVEALFHLHRGYVRSGAYEKTRQQTYREEDDRDTDDDADSQGIFHGDWLLHRGCGSQRSSKRGIS